MTHLYRVLADFLDKSEEELSSAFKDMTEEEVSSELGTLISERGKAIRSEAIRSGHGRGLKEALSKKEKEIAEKYELEYNSGKNLDELIDELVSVKMASVQAPELTPEQIISSEVHKTALSDIRKSLESRDNEIETLKSRYKETMISQKIDPFLNRFLEENKYILPKSEKARQNQIAILRKKLLKNENYRLDLIDDRLGILDSNGEEALVDGYKKHSLENYTKQFADQYFDISAGDNRGGTGAQTQFGSPTAVKIESSEDFRKKYREAKTDAERESIKTSYREAQAS